MEGIDKSGTDYDNYGDWFLDVFDIYVTGKKSDSPANNKGRFCKSQGQCKLLMGKLCNHFSEGQDYQYGD